MCAKPLNSPRRNYTSSLGTRAGYVSAHVYRRELVRDAEAAGEFCRRYNGCRYLHRRSPLPSFSREHSSPFLRPFCLRCIRAMRCNYGRSLEYVPISAERPAVAPPSRLERHVECHISLARPPTREFLAKSRLESGFSTSRSTGVLFFRTSLAFVKLLLIIVVAELLSAVI